VRSAPEARQAQGALNQGFAAGYIIYKKRPVLGFFPGFLGYLCSPDFLNPFGDYLSCLKT